MRLILDKILWGTFIVLFGPTVMIVASWNALPGDNLYGVKLTLEKAALALASPSYATSGNLQIKYTERRFAEAKQLMASKQSIQGLPYLDQQIAETKRMIDNAPNKQAQITLAKQYINTLTTVSTNLEVQKQAVTTGTTQAAYGSTAANQTTSPSPSIPTATNTLTPQPTNTPTQPPPATPTRAINTAASSAPNVTNTPAPRTPTPTATPTNTPVPSPKSQIAVASAISTGQAVVALQINQTQQNVSQAIADLQTLVDNDDRDQKDNRRDDRRESDEKKVQEKKEKSDNDNDR